MLNNILIVILFLLLIGIVVGCGSVLILGIGLISQELAVVLGSITFLLGYILFFMTWFAFSILLSILNVRVYSTRIQRDPLPFSKYKNFWLLKHRPKAYLMTFLGTIVYGLIGSLGVFACYFGVFLTFPLGMVMTARIKAQWNENVTQALAQQKCPWLQNLESCN